MHRYRILVITGFMLLAACQGLDADLAAGSTGTTTLALSVRSTLEQPQSDDAVEEKPGSGEDKEGAEGGLSLADDADLLYTLTDARLVVRRIELYLPHGLHCRDFADQLSPGARCESDDDARRSRGSDDTQPDDNGGERDDSASDDTRPDDNGDDTFSDDTHPDDRGGERDDSASDDTQPDDDGGDRGADDTKTEDEAGDKPSDDTTDDTTGGETGDDAPGDDRLASWGAPDEPVREETDDSGADGEVKPDDGEGTDDSTPVRPDDETGDDEPKPEDGVEKRRGADDTQPDDSRDRSFDDSRSRSTDDTLHAEGDDKIVIDGPFVVDLLSGTTTPDLGDIRVPALAYRRIDIRVDDAVRGGALDRLSFLARASFDYMGVSAELVIALRFSEDIRLELPGGVEVGPTLAVEFDAAQWLEGVRLGDCLDDSSLDVLDGQVVIDEDARGSCEDVEDVVRANIARSGSLTAHVR